MENRNVFEMPVHDSMSSEELNMKHAEMLKDLMSQMDVKGQDDHRAKIAEREYWRKLRGDIFLKLLDINYSCDMILEQKTDLVNLANVLTERLYMHDKDFFGELKEF